VIDSGYGVPASIRQTLFQPFVSTEKINGIGLGLAIVDCIVKEHGGYVDLERPKLKIVKKIDPDAYEDYLKGRYFWSKRTADGLKKAVDYFNQAIAKDPNYAAPYSGLADTFALLGDWQYAVMPTKEAVPKAKPLR
jgi:tetratricopeptide (TPR) repeat protein